MEYAIIGGTGVYDPALLDNVRQERVSTPYGEVAVQVGTFRGVEVAFMPRHGQAHSIPPHKINYRANIWALRALGVRRALATAAVGSLNPDMEPGHFVIIDQFLDFTKSREHTFFDGGPGGVVHTDVTAPYCPALRSRLIEKAGELDLTVHSTGVYVCTEGPRFESAAEIRAYRILGGDVVGMTNVPESTLAREAGLCYATMAMVTNMAAGISKTPLTHDEVVEIMAANTENVRNLALETIAAGVEAPCTCADSPGALIVEQQVERQKVRVSAADGAEISVSVAQGNPGDPSKTEKGHTL